VEVLSEKPVKKDKYNTTRVEVVGIDGVTRKLSKKESTRFYVLKMLLQTGEISDLKQQVRYVLLTSEIKGRQGELAYIADFVYMRGGVEVVEDVKGLRTKIYLRKRGLMQKLHGITILET
jgi:hypothetical protein